MPKIMGVINLTPDSFYAASRVVPDRSAAATASRMVSEGADMLDLGGESTRPGSEPVPLEEECRRVLPAVEAVASSVSVPISIDTTKAEVARRARRSGAGILNDISALRADPAMLREALEYPRVILMHMRGAPKTMQENPVYGDVVADIRDFFEERLGAFERAGGDPSRVILDPGIGFGKTLEHNLDILRRLEELRALGRPLALGVSRKSFIGGLLDEGGGPPPPEERLEGSLAAACRAAWAGVDVIRTHDVLATRRALTAFSAMEPAGRES